ncbi:RIFT barrel domain-containing protein [Trichlorobacter ammonificans]|uniref:PcRGLX/YetA-like N-terminal RIFT barrel domain-containing protein n=1 Tax=Trichlorobacter ammonificans TaxID=2916410 RepID=A0ABM9DAK0_9BACT|nr:hypothetical protein [Trichlorobacter ammonificans]CAH2031390.1 conserved protein of unknown function [Trichlorobacter ammonificans]
MREKELLVHTGFSSANRSEYVRIGIPCARGELPEPSGLAMVAPTGDERPVQAEALARWRDGSVKWLLLDFLADASPGGSSSYRLVRTTVPPPPPPDSPRVTAGERTWLVTTGAATFRIDAEVFRPFSGITAGGVELLAAEGALCLLELHDSGPVVPRVATIDLETAGPVRTTLRIKGTCSIASGSTDLHYTARLHFFAGSPWVVLEVTLRNCRRAEHPGGFWDLGDPGSLLIREFGFRFPLRPGLAEQVDCSPLPGASPVRADDPATGLLLYQESSGGANWQSPLHRNRHGHIPHTIRGFRLTAGEELLMAGGRATPFIRCGNADHGIAVGMPRFWQQFPRTLAADREAVTVGIFPRCYPDLHELQGGEQTTATLHLAATTDAADAVWLTAPFTVTAAPAVYRRAGVLPDLPADPANGGSLIDRFIAGPECILAKREEIDEYGWRNFGEVYADHEAVQHRGSEPFVSHYGNQYDLCAGMYRMAFATGMPLWGELAGDLARHLRDIDIYHTDRDREEYNHGLFWHTDHYVPAGLATHRSYSREQAQYRNRPSGGGGPGAEHCYTTGLLLHYLHSGDTACRDAVIELARWCLASLNGSRTLLATVHNALRYGRRLWRHNGSGTLPFPRYPLTRGTGNGVIACLDAFEAGGGRWFLEQAETLIRGALHPADDIAARNLLEAEDAWSYTVLLAAVAAYLEKKRELAECDEPFRYARACLLAYAEWMLKHEYPYLDKPEILEYPNETWPAQDLRKSVILFHASRHAAAEGRDAFREKAWFFYETARQELHRHPTSRLTRPVALMLQNGWVGARLMARTSLPEPLPAAVAADFGSPTPRLAFSSVLRRVATELGQALAQPSLARELAWLRPRLRNLRYTP